MIAAASPVNPSVAPSRTPPAYRSGPPAISVALAKAPAFVPASNQFAPPPSILLPPGPPGMGRACALIPYPQWSEALPRDVYMGKCTDNWVNVYGVAGYPAPSSKSLERPWIDVHKVCSSAGLNIPLPPGFPLDGAGSLGGDTCPFCAEHARHHSFVQQWYHHPSAPEFVVGSSPVKPLGFEHNYIHQAKKCPLGLAQIHVACRKEIDAGRPPPLWMFLNSPPPMMRA